MIQFPTWERFKGGFYSTYSIDDLTLFAKNIIGFFSHARVLLLTGSLGAGKTFFARHVLRLATAIPDLRVLSPTFSIVNFYDTKDCGFAHIDCYRIRSLAEMIELGIEEMFAERICLIEWPDLVKPMLINMAIPSLCLEITDDENSLHNRSYKLSKLF